MRKIGKRIGSVCAVLQRTLRQPKWRHGQWSALMMAVFIAICVLVNIGVESLETEYGWRRDYSFNSYATTGEETAEIVARIDQPIDIYLLYQNGQMDSQLMEILNRYAVLSEYIRIAPTDIAKNPGIVTRFKGDLDAVLEADTVVVHCVSTDSYKALTYNDFVMQGYNMKEGTFEIAGLAYEKKLTEALVYVTEEEIPVVGVLAGHGELTMGELQSFIEFLSSNHYDSKSVSLLEGESLDDIDLLLIAGPQKDLSEAELQAISAFNQRGGSMLILRDYFDPVNLTGYFSLLKSYGIEPLSGVVVASEDDEGSYYGERIYLLPYLCELDMTLPLIISNMDILLLAGASAFETPGEPSGSLTVGTVLKSGPNAYLRDPSDGNTTTVKQPGDRTGEMSLALYAHRMHATGNVSRAIAIGNSSLFTDESIYQRTYNQQFFMQILGELLPQKAVSLDIMTSAAFRPELRVGSQTAGIILIACMPVLALAVALCVLLPRRNR